MNVLFGERYIGNYNHGSDNSNGDNKSHESG